MTLSGQFGTVYMGRTNAGTGTYNVDLTQPDFPSGAERSGRAKIIRLDLLAGGSRDGTPDRFTMQLDWVSLHRADTRPPDAFAPQVVKLTSPSEEGGADYAHGLRKCVGLHRARRCRHHRRSGHQLLRQR